MGRAAGGLDGGGMRRGGWGVEVAGYSLRLGRVQQAP